MTSGATPRAWGGWSSGWPLALGLLLVGCVAEEPADARPVEDAGATQQDAGATTQDASSAPADSAAPAPGPSPIACSQAEVTEVFELAAGSLGGLRFGLDGSRVVYVDGRIWSPGEGGWIEPLQVPILEAGPQAQVERTFAPGAEAGKTLLVATAGDHPSLVLDGAPYNMALSSERVVWRSAAGLHAVNFATGEGGLLPGSAPCPTRDCSSPWARNGDTLYYLSEDDELLSARPGGDAEVIAQVAQPVRLYGGERSVAYTTTQDGVLALALQTPAGQQVVRELPLEVVSFGGRFGPGDAVFVARWGGPDAPRMARAIRTADGETLWEGVGLVSVTGPDDVWVRTSDESLHVQVSDGGVSRLPGPAEVRTLGDAHVALLFGDGTLWLLPAGQDEPAAVEAFHESVQSHLACTVDGTLAACGVDAEIVVFDLSENVVLRRFTPLRAERVLPRARLGGLHLTHSDAPAPDSLVLPPFREADHRLIEAHAGRSRRSSIYPSTGPCPGVVYVQTDADETLLELVRVTWAATD